jgi:hypothetical protein
MNQTAVNWLIEQLEKEYNSFPLLNAESCIKAQQMEKEQIIDARATAPILPTIDKADYLIEALQYYNETFKSE